MEVVQFSVDCISELHLYIPTAASDLEHPLKIKWGVKYNPGLDGLYTDIKLLLCPL